MPNKTNKLHVLDCTFVCKYYGIDVEEYVYGIRLPRHKDYNITVTISDLSQYRNFGHTGGLVTLKAFRRYTQNYLGDSDVRVAPKCMATLIRNILCVTKVYDICV